MLGYRLSRSGVTDKNRLKIKLRRVTRRNVYFHFRKIYIVQDNEGCEHATFPTVFYDYIYFYFVVYLMMLPVSQDYITLEILSVTTG
jgi:hypothetical protein